MSSIMGQDNFSNSKPASHVNFDHFDPEGVRDLSRTLTQPSPQAERTRILSDRTLSPDEDFSLEKTLGAALDKCAPVGFT